MSTLTTHQLEPGIYATRNNRTARLIERLEPAQRDPNAPKESEFHRWRGQLLDAAGRPESEYIWTETLQKNVLAVFQSNQNTGPYDLVQFIRP